MTTVKNFTSCFLNLSAQGKFFLFILFVNFFAPAYNQVIKGTVLEMKTKRAIPFATVYFNGTFNGTTTNQNGKFELDITKNASRPLTISAIGYYSSSLTDFTIGNPAIIYLIPKAYKLKEVVIVAESHARERKANLKLFKNEFLGTTANARNCKIMNESDITFNYGSDNDTVKAIALKPIHVKNDALGYKITYYLDEFEYCKKSNTMFFTGSIIFNEDLTTDKTHKQFYERRRRKAYLGSRMHFFRALWSGDLRSNKFTINDSTNKKLNIKKNIVQENDKRFLKYTENLTIYYYTRLSKINFLKEQVFFDQDGYFDPSGISWKGVMGRQRIADWLPYEYSIE